MDGFFSSGTAHCSNSSSSGSSSSSNTSSKPHISCHTPLKPNYAAEDMIVPWETLNFRYKAPPKPARKIEVPHRAKKKHVKSKKETSKSACQESKKKHSKHKRESSKTDHRESKPESNSTNASLSAEGNSTCSADLLTSDDPGHAGCHISALPQCCLLRIFCCLPICNLLRAGLTCSAWYRLSLDKSIWKSVALENANISSWKRAAKALQVHGTITLDFYNMANEEAMGWESMYCILKRLPGLQYLRFGYAHTNLLLKVIHYLPDLRVLEVCWLTNEYSERMDGVVFDLGKLSKLIHLRELKIRAINSLLQPSVSFSGGLASLEKLKHLRKLSLTSQQKSRIMPSDYAFLTKLPELVELELGDCGNWRSETYDTLSKLTKLRSLRLENGGCWCCWDCTPQCTCNISDSLRKLTELEKLELIMYIMPSDINPALQFLIKLQSLTFWPMVCLALDLRSIEPAFGLETLLIQTNLDKCQALGNLRHLRQLTWAVPIITFDTPMTDYPYNMTTEKAIGSPPVLALADTLAKQLPETAVDILIVPVVMSKDHYEHSFDSADDDDDSSGWGSEREYSDTDDSDSDIDHECAMDFGIPFGY